MLGVVLAVSSLARPIWAIALYFLTFYAAPQLWWWGDQVPRARYAFWAGGILLLAVALYRSREKQSPERVKLAYRVAIAWAVNLIAVHVFLSNGSSVNLNNLIELLKFTLLYFLFEAAISEKRDLRTALMAIALGAGYIGYEVTINERGTFSASRLEGVGAPGADTANGLASLMLASLPLAGTLFVSGTVRERLVVLLTAPLILNVVILCNSRGAFLGLIAAGLTLIFLARGETRKKALQVALLGSVLLYLLLGDPEILQRFATTFVGSEERDNSAASRLVFWEAGLRMLWDHPLGAGGGAFKYHYATDYLRQAGSDEAARSLHNGYLTDATDWGVQGLALKLTFFAVALLAAFRTSERNRRAGHHEDALIGLSLIAGNVAFLVCCVFGSYLSNEWAFWNLAFLTRYAVVYAPERVAQESEAPAVVIEAHPLAPRIALPSAVHAVRHGLPQRHPRA